MNIFNIANAFKQKVERKWHTLYIMVDAHGTIVKPYHDKLAFYDGSLKVLKWFSDRSDIKLILWTSSHSKEINELLAVLKENGIEVDFVNENPLEKNSALANFDRKFYFNIILDDKAGFEPEVDWLTIKSELQRIGEWNKQTMTAFKTKTKRIVKRPAIFTRRLDPILGYGQTGSVTSEPINGFVTFVNDDNNKRYSVHLENLYFPNDYN